MLLFYNKRMCQQKNIILLFLSTIKQLSCLNVSPKVCRHSVEPGHGTFHLHGIDSTLGKGFRFFAASGGA